MLDRLQRSIMIANPNHKTIDDPPSTRDLTSSIFLHVTIVYRLTHPCRDILNQLQSHNKVCCNNLDRLQGSKMIASISAVDEHVSTGDPRQSNIAFNDGTSMIDDLSIFEMDRINITKNCCNIVRTIQKNWMTLNCLINQDPQSNKWAGFSSGSYDYFKFS